MGLFDFWKKQKVEANRTAVIAGETSHSTSEYSSFELAKYDMVMNCIRIITEEIVKCEPKHFLCCAELDDDISGLLRYPNDIDTPTTFISQILFGYFINNNAVILKTYNEKANVIELTPLITNNMKIRTNERGETIYIFEIYEESGRMERELKFYADDIIHIKRDVSNRRYVGGTKYGNDELLDYVKLYEELHDNLQRAVKLIPNVNIELTPIVTKDEELAVINQFKDTLTKTGFAVSNPKYKVTAGNGAQLTNNQNVTIEHLKYYEQLVCDHFKMSSAILHGTYTHEEWESFYNATIKPILKVLSDAFTKGLFTKTQIKKGHRIEFYQSDLFLMSISEKREFMRDAKGAAFMMTNEFRKMFDFHPIEDGNRITQRLDEANIEIVDQLQVEKQHEKARKYEKEKQKELEQIQDEGVETDEQE